MSTFSFPGNSFCLLSYQQAIIDSARKVSYRHRCRLHQLLRDAHNEEERLSLEMLFAATDFLSSWFFRIFPAKITCTPENNIRIHWKKFGWWGEYCRHECKKDGV